MRRTTLPAIAIILCTALVAGCGSSKKSSSNSSSAPAPATTPGTTTSASGGAAPSGGVVEVKMQNIAFSPATVQAKVGQTIKWTNEDAVDHNVIGSGAQSFRSPSAFGQGGTFSVKLTKPGTIKFICSLHPATMGNGKIVVTK